MRAGHPATASPVSTPRCSPTCMDRPPTPDYSSLVTLGSTPRPQCRIDGRRYFCPPSDARNQTSAGASSMENPKH